MKDLFAIKGYRIGAGNPTFLDESRAETTTAPAVADLLRGGASLRGIARTDEFAYSIAGDNVHYGTPPNGAVPGALPGGSSSGPASAVATGQAEIGLATDTAGSIRVPASYQGLWGLRTTHGLVPRQGLLPARAVLRHGRLAHTRRRDAAAGRRLVPELRRLRVDRERLRRVGRRPAVAVPGARRGARAVEPDTRAAFDALLVDGSRHPMMPPTFARVSIGDLDAYFAPFRTVQAAEAWRNNGEWVRAHPGAVGPAVAERFRLAAGVTAEDETSARAALEPLREQLEPSSAARC